MIFTGNYGEAGAIDRYGPALGLPSAYSGHNGFGYWGPPSSPPGPVVTVGVHATRGLREFTGCRWIGRVENAAGIENSESAEPIYLCSRPIAPWRVVWPRLRHLG